MRPGQRTCRNELAQVEQELGVADLTEDKESELIARKQEIEQNIVMNIEMSKPMSREKMILDSSGMMSLVTLLMIIASAGIVASEFSQGTIKMLLSRPVKRWKILTSKYVTVLLFGLLLTVVTYVSSVVGAFIFYPGYGRKFVGFTTRKLPLRPSSGKSHLFSASRLCLCLCHGDIGLYDWFRV